MIIAKDTFENMINSPVRTLRGRVEIYQGSILALICSCHDRLKDFKIERIGEQNKFFGYGICQKLTTNLLDRNRELNITKDNTLEVEFGVGSDYVYPCPNFHIEDVKRDENTNDLTITAYDALYVAAAHTVSELSLPASYTIGQFAEACAAILGVPLKETAIESFNTLYENGANFDGTETIREALNAIAEATQTIYYIDSNWELTFKQLDIAGDPVATIDKTKYFTLNSKDAVSISSVAHVTELGNNLTASTGTGATQYVRDNPFWEMREDIADLVNNALAAITGLTINPFECEWRGNYLLEIGDKVALITKDDKAILSYILDDTIEFDGALSGKTQWSYTEDKAETASNPSTIGEAIKQTFARVDKVNKQIELVASESSANSEAIAALQLDTNSISASVSEEIANLKESVNMQMTPEAVTVLVKDELDNGVTKIETSTGVTVDDRGLTIDKSDSDLKTTISDNGMTIYNDNEEDNPMLKADNIGVKAKNLHATTYLIVGENSRFEDYDGGNRTGCFWIGG